MTKQSLQSLPSSRSLRLAVLASAGAALMLSGCASMDSMMKAASDSASSLFASSPEAQKFEKSEDFANLIAANEDKAVPTEQRLRVLSYLVSPAYYKSPEELAALKRDYEYKLDALGCSAVPFGGQGSGLSVLKNGRKNCLSMSEAPGDNYIISLREKSEGGRSFLTAHIVHPRSDDLAAHTAGMKALSWRGSQLYQLPWATVVKKGSSFFLVPKDFYETAQKAKKAAAAAAKKMPAAKSAPQASQEPKESRESLEKKLDVLDML